MSKTLVQIKHALLDFFTQEDTIHPETQAEVVKFECEDKSLKAALVRAALEELEKDDIVRKVVVDTSRSVWVLVKPLSMYQRPIICGYDTIGAVANCINEFLKAGGNERDLVDATQLNETNIQTLVLIAEGLMNKAQQKSG
jgi:hypothetical protein